MSNQFRVVDKSNRYIKICCISSVEESEIAIESGASAIGLVSEMPSGPGIITEASIAEIIQHVNRRVETFLLSSLRDAASIVAQHQRCPSSTLQFVDYVSCDELTKVRLALPQTKLVQVIHVSGEHSIDRARMFEPFVDAILLDSGMKRPELAQLGGTGSTHDWTISRRICESLSAPVFLAGGLRSSNVGVALRSVPAFGVDVCSGVRTDEKLDHEKLALFIRNARAST